MKHSVKLKFRDNLNEKQVDLLVNIYGFRYFSRSIGNWIIYERVYNQPKAVVRILSDNEMDTLNDKCMNFIKVFDKSHQTKNHVAMCVRDMGRCLDYEEQAYIDNWVLRNIDEVGNDDLPWIIE